MKWMNRFLVMMIAMVMVMNMGGGCMAEVVSTPIDSGGVVETTPALSGAAAEIHQKGTSILRVIMWFGYAIALGMVIFIGIKYVLGAADAKANMKNAVTGWLIGAFIVFMASSIVGWVINAATDKSISGESVVKALVNDKN